MMHVRLRLGDKFTVFMEKREYPGVLKVSVSGTWHHLPRSKRFSNRKRKIMV